MSEGFTAEERAALAPHFTNLDGPVFALVDLPEVVKGALFARYSRSPKSLRRLFLDEFSGDIKVRGGEAPPLTTPRPTPGQTPSLTTPRPTPGQTPSLTTSRPTPGQTPSLTTPRFTPDQTPSATTPPGSLRAEQLYERVFFEYGDDSVAQLGGVHLACEGASNILTKVLEWGRLMAYLEQSTRYIPYDDRPGGRWRYHVPAALTGALRQRYTATLDRAFETYAAWLPRLRDFYAACFPKAAGDSEPVYRATLRAKTLDTLRGLLPAATVSNVGLYGTGQAYEQLLLRMRAHPLTEVRSYADLMLAELRKVIPAFLRRVDLPDRGAAWSGYLADTREATQKAAERLLGGIAGEPREEVTLTDFDPDGEIRVVAAALYAASELPDDQLLAIARQLTPEERLGVLQAYVGTRGNRRHKPGRAFERTGYRFDVLADYGAFRDLQRHRLLTLEWQRLTPRHGWVIPAAVEDAGGRADWERVMTESAALHDAVAAAASPEVASYAVAMAYRVRFFMAMNAREAMHVIELRSAPQGHPAYRRICQTMHRLIAEQAGHRAIAAAMSFADHSEVALERLEAERAAERRRAQP